MLGDSITDMGRNRDVLTGAFSYGNGYPFFVQGELSTSAPQKYTVYNKGISGNRVVDLYARIKADCWNLQPDVISILIGINDIWHEINWNNGVELDRFVHIYEMILEETRARFPAVKFMLLEPFVLKGSDTEENYERFLEVKKYAQAVQDLAAKKDCVFVPLQEKLDALAKETGDSYWLYDGVHPHIAGSKVIADAWLEGFKKLL